MSSVRKKQRSLPSATNFRELMPSEGESLPVRRMRDEAMRRFENAGFPSVEVEEWRYTSLAEVAGSSYRRALPVAIERQAVEGFSFGDRASAEIVFVNGHVDTNLSLLHEQEGVRIRSYSGMARSEDSAELFHVLIDAPLVDLNTALLSDGAIVEIAAGARVEKPIHLVYVYSGSDGSDAAVTSHVRTRIVAGENASAHVVESHVGLDDHSAFVNSVTTLDTAQGARVEHSLSQHLGLGTTFVASILGIQQKDSTLRSSVITIGAALTRNELTIRLEGEGSELTMDGLYLIRGSQHADNHTVIDHVAPRATSTELYKGILAQHAKGIFDGKIIVRKGAQQTSSRQTNNNLLLSNDAIADSKPQLEIHADDVKCNHGSTIGQLDDESIFYLQSRGIGYDDARSLLTYAFASEIVERLSAVPLRERLQAILLQRMERP